MCGICCVLDVNSDEALQFWKDCIKKQSRLYRRGPDGSQDKQVTVCDNRNILLSGHILHLRGHMTRQPLKDKNGNFLLWNGEIFGGNIEVLAEDNDTAVLLSVLASCTDVDEVLSTLAKVQGPWSVIFWQETTKCLWFGRDMFGRRSLLWHLPKDCDDKLIISSSQIDDQDFQEIPSVGLFCIKFQSSHGMQFSDLDITLYPRQDSMWPGTMDKVLNTKSLNNTLCGNQTDKSSIMFTLDTNHIMPAPLPKLNKIIPTVDDGLPSCDSFDTKISSDQQKYLQYLIESDHVISKLADQLISLLQKSVMVRTFNQPLLKHSQPTLLHQKRNLEQMTVDQCTTKVKTDHKPDEQDSCTSDSMHNLHANSSAAGVKRTSHSLECKQDSNTESSVSDIKHAKPADTGTTSTYLDSRSSKYLTSSTSSHRQSLSCSSPSTATVSGSSLWDTSDKSDRSSANVAILFSGGIDSAVLAALVDRCLPEKESVDLINVAFEQNISMGKQGVSQDETDSQRWNVPDRQTGYSALAELNPNRTWNFVEVNVTVQELQKARSEHVRHLVYPSETVLDDSIGCAVWFAARGEGVIGHGVRKGCRYTSSSRVILCGMGADEQFAGYSRHRGKFEELGWQGLVDEIELEITRISARNLGRDDRVITDHGKESRFPFLDENVVEFLSSLPVQNKANLNLPRGLGEKLLLRVCATKLGLKATAVLPKRAIQFGSRIAKLENSKEKASDKCDRLKD